MKTIRSERGEQGESAPHKAHPRGGANPKLAKKAKGVRRPRMGDVGSIDWGAAYRDWPARPGETDYQRKVRERESRVNLMLLQLQQTGSVNYASVYGETPKGASSGGNHTATGQDPVDGPGRRDGAELRQVPKHQGGGEEEAHAPDGTGQAEEVQ